jgi:predicted nucleic acid-binding Zn ribbon protein
MQNMREMLRSSLGRSLGTLAALDRLTAAWPVACGPALARRGEIVSFEDGVLRIVIADPAWMDQMRGMQAMLERELARIAEVKLGGIHFELKNGLRKTGRRKQ